SASGFDAVLLHGPARGNRQPWRAVPGSAIASLRPFRGFKVLLTPPSAEACRTAPAELGVHAVCSAEPVALERFCARLDATLAAHLGTGQQLEPVVRLAALYDPDDNAEVFRSGAVSSALATPLFRACRPIEPSEWQHRLQWLR